MGVCEKAATEIAPGKEEEEEEEEIGGGILLAFSEKRTVVTKLAGHCGVGKEAFSIQMFVIICLCKPMSFLPSTFRSCVDQSWHLLSDDPNLVRRSCKKTHSHMWNGHCLARSCTMQWVRKCRTFLA